MQLEISKPNCFNVHVCEAIDMSLNKDVCLICMNEGADVRCKHCNNQFHLSCLYIAYQAKSKHIYNGRCPYCTNALPIYLRIQLHDKSINTWLREAVDEDDRVMRRLISIDRASLASILCDKRTRAYLYNRASNDELAEYAEADKCKRRYIEYTKPLVAAIYKVNTIENKNKEACLMNELLKISETVVIDIDDKPSMLELQKCPICESNLRDDECRECHKRWMSFEYNNFIALVSCERSIELSAEAFDEIEYMSYSELRTFISEAAEIKHVDANLLNTSVKRLIDEAIKPLAYSTLELTSNAVIFAPLERKRAIARHAYLSMNRYRLMETLKAILYPETKRINLFDLKPTIEALEAELELIDELIIENSLETKLLRRM